MTTVASFEIRYSRFLDSQGRATRPLPDFAEDGARLVALYRAMLLTRSFDTKAVALQRTGRLGTFASSLGQEAVSVGIGDALRADDILVPSFREQGAQFMRGVTMVDLLLYWGGDERGSDFAGPREDFPICVPVGTHAPHAAGAALALKLRGEARAVLCVVGDGGTSKGDVYEAMNFAGVWRLPLVFVVNNNQWAISVPRKKQTAAATLAQKAVAAGIPGEQVDGNDVIAVSEAVRWALERARKGEGPSLIEALTYRLSDHTTADDATRYRSDEEVSRAWKEEPIARLRSYLVAQDLWSKADEEQLIAECAAAVEQAADDYLATAPMPPTAMFDHLYATLPDDIAWQRDALAAEATGDAATTTSDDDG
ncbi:MAG: pyruvate dehydrogenase (acetyl-transferring) E1 component subunit alpha [Kiloniellales bacterium]